MALGREFVTELPAREAPVGKPFFVEIPELDRMSEDHLLMYAEQLTKRDPAPVDAVARVLEEYEERKRR